MSPRELTPLTFELLRECNEPVAGDAGYEYKLLDAMPVELALMNWSEMPALETIRAATGRAARVIGHIAGTEKSNLVVAPAACGT